MSSQILLSGGDKWYSYSGVLFGDVTVPATIPMITIANTGLKDSYVKIQPYFALEVASAPNNSFLGVLVSLNDNTIVKTQYTRAVIEHDKFITIELFIPRQSKLEVLSLNTSANNTQERGVNLIGYYL